jgi:hypothetical protein
MSQLPLPAAPQKVAGGTGRLVALLKTIVTRLRSLPIADFYLYMWKNDRLLLFNTLFVNYTLPVILEAMPWFLSRSKLSKHLRDTRNTIQHAMIGGKRFAGTKYSANVIL